ncbi:hypothetical protein [Chryseobacterium candidae]|jgi:hypothetical protein|uniref:hypothetical protein n=1 Tax=Chryseobacterium candidae TaxID=1978493 RepID=UPI0014576AAE|nr:hypothetical protein [Chryseobacterium candidae]
MKQKKEISKKLSLKKLQLTRIINPNSIKGGSDLNYFNGDDEPTGTGRTKR